MLNILYIFSYHLCSNCIEIRCVVINNVILFNSRTVLNVSELKRDFQRIIVTNTGTWQIKNLELFLESINI